MIRQMDSLLILSEKDRMADGGEVKREHLEGDRECAGPRMIDDTGAGLHIILLNCATSENFCGTNM